MRYKINSNYNDAIYVDADMTSITNNGDLLLLKVYEKNGKEEKDLLLALAKSNWTKVEIIEE